MNKNEVFRLAFMWGLAVKYSGKLRKYFYSKTSTYGMTQGSPARHGVVGGRNFRIDLHKFYVNQLVIYQPVKMPKAKVIAWSTYCKLVR